MNYKKLEPKIVYLHKKINSLRINPTKDSLTKILDLSNQLDEVLDKYYSDKLFFMKLNNEMLFATYLSIRKQVLKEIFKVKILKEYEKKRN